MFLQQETHLSLLAPVSAPTQSPFPHNCCLSRQPKDGRQSSAALRSKPGLVSGGKECLDMYVKHSTCVPHSSVYVQHILSTNISGSRVSLLNLPLILVSLILGTSSLADRQSPKRAG